MEYPLAATATVTLRLRLKRDAEPFGLRTMRPENRSPTRAIPMCEQVARPTSLENMAIGTRDSELLRLF